MEIRMFDDNSVQLEGYINVTERKSRIMTDSKGKFVEIIKGGTFKRALNKNNNILMLLDHNFNKQIGKTGDNLELREDHIGLHYKATITDEETVKLAKENKLIGCSFGFNNATGHRYKGKILDTREIKDLDLVEVSILSINKIPAYSGCSIEVRGLNDENIELELRNIEDYKNENVDMSTVYNADTFIVRNREEYTDMNKLKGLKEKRNSLLAEMEGLINKAAEEVRAFDETESARVDEIKKEISDIDNTIKAINETRELEKVPEVIAEKREEGNEVEVLEKRDVEVVTLEEQRALEDEKIFVEMINGKRALDIANNGAIIPETIANRIIEKVKELSPIVSMATIFNEGGNLKFPVYDETTAIEATYVDDMAELTEQTGKFTTVSLQNYIVGSLAKISKSLANRTNIDVASFAINKVAQSLAEFLEKELIVGKTKMKGLTTCANGQTITGATAGKITADELIDLQLSVPQVYQAKACWIVNKTDFALIRKLKDGDGNYLMSKDYVAGFGYTLLGKTVYISENADAVYYGDMSGLYVKFAQNVE